MAPGHLPLRSPGDVVTRDLEGLETENADLRRRVHALERERVKLERQIERQGVVLGGLAERASIATLADVEEAVRRTVVDALQQMLRPEGDRS